jgi:hypothetical protein
MRKWLFSCRQYSLIPTTLLFLCHMFAYWLGSCSDGYFYMKQTYVGGGAASISAVSNEPVNVWRVPCGKYCALQVGCQAASCKVHANCTPHNRKIHENTLHWTTEYCVVQSD